MVTALLSDTDQTVAEVEVVTVVMLVEAPE